MGGSREKDRDEERSLTRGNVERSRSTISTKQSKKGEMLSSLLGMLTAVGILAIVAVIAIVVYESNKEDSVVEGTNDCGQYNYTGVNISALIPNIVTEERTCKIGGGCWKGEECYKCFKLDQWKVGTINGVPVCCPDCELAEMSFSNSNCTCVNNIK